MSYMPERPGFSKSYHGGDVPVGYLLEDGSLISRTTYAALFAAIGVAHGSGDGSTTFNLPDSRGLIERYVDTTATVDPDADARTAMASGGNTGAAVGSVQEDQFGYHGHSYVATQFNIVYASISGGSLAGGSTPGGTGGAGGNETRPKNFYATKMIKY